MAILAPILTVLLVVNCVVLLIVILLQRGKGGGLSGAFGGVGGAESAFGTRAATTAKKATAVMAALFIVLTALLGYVRRVSREGLAAPEIRRTVPPAEPPGPADTEPGEAKPSLPAGK